MTDEKHLWWVLWGLGMIAGAAFCTTACLPIHVVCGDPWGFMTFLLTIPALGAAVYCFYEAHKLLQK